MNKVLYGTVSALALMLAAHGVAQAQQTSSATATGAAAVQNNNSNGPFANTLIIDSGSNNLINDNAFDNAKGAFNVLQNQSINSAVQQGMSIAAIVNKAGTPDNESDSVAAVGLGTSVAGNFANNARIANNSNLITDEAFSHAAGAFNVLQDKAVNSAVQQAMAIGAIVNKGNGLDDDAKILTANASVSETASNVVNQAVGSSIASPNTINDDAFKNAKGAFQVLQNSSINSSVQQGMAIAATVNTGGGADSLNLSTASVTLVDPLAGALSAGAAISSDNMIANNAFENAKGAFNVLQNLSINSDVQQGMAIAAIVNNGGTGAGGGQNFQSTATFNGAATVSVNNAQAAHVDSFNAIDNFAFDHAAGAFNVLQNRSINSDVQQGMAIAAQVNNIDRDEGALDNDTHFASATAHATATATVSNNVTGDLVVNNVTGFNTIQDNAFNHAAGAFNVLQNASINSSVQQGMAIAAVVNRDNDGDPLASFDLDQQHALSTAALSATVTGNTGSAGGFTNILASNTITNHAFDNAKGAFQVMQNQSVNSAVQQTMSISAVVNK
jgi:hypothetical protein